MRICYRHIEIPGIPWLLISQFDSGICVLFAFLDMDEEKEKRESRYPRVPAGPVPEFVSSTRHPPPSPHGIQCIRRGVGPSVLALRVDKSTCTPRLQGLPSTKRPPKTTQKKRERGRRQNVSLSKSHPFRLISLLLLRPLKDT